MKRFRTVVARARRSAGGGGWLLAVQVVPILALLGLAAVIVSCSHATDPNQIGGDGAGPIGGSGGGGSGGGGGGGASGSGDGSGPVNGRGE